MPAPTVSLIAIVARNGGIGRGNALLVHLPDDLAHFKKTTFGAPILMGRKTWQSIGRPLPGRRNIVITRSAQFEATGAETAPDLASALARVADAQKVYVVGGASVYAAALPFADELVLTEIDLEIAGDATFPEWPQDEFPEVQRDERTATDGTSFAFVTYRRRAP